jgi:bacterioferritin-associated ferredoxin
VTEQDPRAVYICLCNALTDRKLRQAAAAGCSTPREAYEACGCRAQCGQCAKAVLELLREIPASVQAGINATLQGAD